MKDRVWGWVWGSWGSLGGWGAQDHGCRLGPRVRDCEAASQGTCGPVGLRAAEAGPPAPSLPPGRVQIFLASNIRSPRPSPGRLTKMKGCRGWEKVV